MIAPPQGAPTLEPGVSAARGLSPRFLHEIFERTARRVPDQVAVELPPVGAQPRRRLTYAEIDALADA
ncbi:MAG TPA: hypothetical protein VIE43_10120, partial [Thermoanaerobaculia bacterium]|nr:hypothetical protein [Thermoanaerobaculia bacterium]